MFAEARKSDMNLELLGGQIAARVKEVARDIIGPLEPIDAADIFAPADDLADEAFGSVDRDPAGPITRLDRAAQSERIEQPGIDIR